MSTHARIGMTLPDGTVRSIYCHFDGYPAHAGVTLQRYWRESVIPLLDLGDLSVLGAEPGQDEGPGAFDARLRARLADDDPRRTWCVAYGRDRGETDVAAIIHPADDWPDFGQAWDYLWTGSEWLARNCYEQTPWTPLTDLIGRSAA